MTFAPFRIDSARHATALTKAFARIERTMERFNESEGRLQAGDFAGYVIRLSRALKIPTVYVRNSKRREEMTGQKYHIASGSALQSWVSMVVGETKEGTVARHIR